MRNAKTWLFASLVAVALAGNATLILTTPPAAAADQKELKDHWRNHDGRWSYWHEGDKRWYYTDGNHWFYTDGNEGSMWRTYGFDKQFGREGFERGEYKVPGEGVKIDAPRHGVYRPR